MSAKILLLHVGLPKTGSTSLQKWCHDNRDLLKTGNVDYPATAPSGPARKHQFVVSELRNGTFKQVEHIVHNADQSKKLLLSTEGLTNHLYDFPEESLARFRTILDGWQVMAFMVVRDAAPWLKSYYKQLVLNPPRPEYGYATELPLEEFGQLPRIQRLLDHASLSRDVQTKLGADSVTVQRFEEDWFSGFMNWAGLHDFDGRCDTPGHEHASCGDEVTELVRLINGMGLPPHARSHCLSTLATTLESSSHARKTSLSHIAAFYSPMSDHQAGKSVWEDVVTDLVRATAPGSSENRLARSMDRPETR
jgi:hypothetical protein